MLSMPFIRITTSAAGYKISKGKKRKQKHLRMLLLVNLFFIIIHEKRKLRRIEDELPFSSSYSDASCSDRTESPAEDKAYGSDLACCYSRRGVES